MSGTTRQKVELEKLISELIKKIVDIDSDETKGQSEKTKLISRAATNFKSQLHDDKRRKEDMKITLSTYRKYMTLARNEITAQNWRHHSLGQQIERLSRKYPELADQLQAIEQLPTITELRMAHKALLDSMKDNVEAYEDLKAMKLDHEVMRHLVMPASKKAKLADMAAEALDEKKNSAVQLQYGELMPKVLDLLTRKTRTVGGDSVFAFGRLALGIALATGRRMIEVIYQGEFEKVDSERLTFRGQAKKRGGADYSEEYTIYTTVDADIVMNAIANLRKLQEVTELGVYESLGETKRNDAINKRCAKTLNTAAKLFFNDETRVFKDSRAIWARIVYEKHFKVDPYWAKKDEDLFWQAMLGHEDLETQKSYKQFKIEFTEWEPEQPAADGFANRAEALAALDAKMSERAALLKIHEWAKAKIEADPEAQITQTQIIRELGSNRKVIGDYLQLAADALATQNPVPEVQTVKAPKPARRQAKKIEKPAPAVKPAATEKPEVKFSRIDAEHHEGWVMVAGEEVVRVKIKGSAMDAMRAAFDAYTGR
uniref:Putative protelomerase n=1 Tax=viral metagenome TaxID=1070528 RepID=A0A6M3KPX8_9ZZZZ